MSAVFGVHNLYRPPFYMILGKKLASYFSQVKFSKRTQSYQFFVFCFGSRYLKTRVAVAVVNINRLIDVIIEFSAIELAIGPIFYLYLGSFYRYWHYVTALRISNIINKSHNRICRPEISRTDFYFYPRLFDPMSLLYE